MLCEICMEHCALHSLMINRPSIHISISAKNTIAEWLSNCSANNIESTICHGKPVVTWINTDKIQSGRASPDTMVNLLWDGYERFRVWTPLPRWLQQGAPRAGEVGLKKQVVARLPLTPRTKNNETKRK